MRDEFRYLWGRSWSFTRNSDEFQPSDITCDTVEEGSLRTHWTEP